MEKKLQKKQVDVGLRNLLYIGLEVLGFESLYSPPEGLLLMN